MDRRYDTRLPSDLPVGLVLLNEDTKTVGGLVDISESGICALLPISLSAGTLVRVDILEVSLYGEIVYSQPETNCFRTGIFVEHVLLETSNVARIVETYLQTAASSADVSLLADSPERHS
jgi:hypothetical protein